MCDTYSFGEASEVIQQGDFDNSNVLQFTDQRLRAQLLEMQLQESKQREQSQKKLNEQLFKAFQETEQRLREINDVQKQKRELQIISEQHENAILQLKEQFEQQSRIQKSDIEILRAENEILKKRNECLEDQKIISQGDSERRLDVLQKENILMNSQIKILQEEIQIYKLNSEQSLSKFEEDLKLQTQNKVQFEKQKWEAEKELLKQEHINELQKIKEQFQQNEIFWSKKIENVNYQRQIIEKYKANDQMLYQLHKDNHQQEIDELRKLNSESFEEIERLRKNNFELQKKLSSFFDLQKEVDLLRLQSNKNEEIVKNYNELESKYVDTKAENELLNKQLKEIQFDLRHSQINQQFEKDELKRRISQERKKSLDLNQKLQNTHQDYSKKQSTIVKEILQQDNKIKTLSKRLSQNELLTQQQQKQLLLPQKSQQQLYQQQSSSQIPLSPTQENTLQTNISMNSSIVANTTKLLSQYNSNASQQLILNSSSQNLSTTSINQKNNKSNKKLSQQNYSFYESSKNNQNQHSKLTLNKPDINSISSITPQTITNKQSFEQQLQMFKKDSKKSVAVPSTNNFSQKKNSGQTFQRSASKGTFTKDYYLENKSMLSNIKNKDRRASNGNFNANNNSTLSIKQQAYKLLSPNNDRSEILQKSDKASINNSNNNQMNSNYKNNNLSGVISQFNKSFNQDTVNQNNKNIENPIQNTPAKNQSLSVAEIIKAHSNNQQQSYQLNNTSTTMFQQQLTNINNNILNDSNVSKLSFINVISPSANSQQQFGSKNNFDFEPCNNKQNYEYNYSSSNISLPNIQNNQNSFLIPQNTQINQFGQQQGGYIIQDIQSAATEQTVETLNTLQNSQALNQIDLLHEKFQQQYNNQNKSNFIQKQNEDDDERFFAALENNISRRMSFYDSQFNKEKYQKCQRLSQPPQIKVEFCIDNSSNLNNQQLYQYQQSNPIAGQQIVSDKVDNFKVTVQQDRRENEFNSQQPLDTISKLHHTNTQKRQNNEQDNKITNPFEKINNNNNNLNKQTQEDKENLNMSQFNRRFSTSSYNKYNHVGLVNDYSHLSKKKNMKSDLISPSAANCQSNFQYTDESFIQFQKQQQQNQFNPSFCSENDRFSIPYNRKLSEANINFNSESIYGTNKQMPSQIIVVDQIEDFNLSESNISYTYLDKSNNEHLKWMNIPQSKITQQNNNLQTEFETEEINQDINEFEGQIERNPVSINFVDKKNIQRLDQNQ